MTQQGEDTFEAGYIWACETMNQWSVYQLQSFIKLPANDRFEFLRGANAVAKLLLASKE